ncbi:MAG: Hsp20 family protein [Candidatus Hydrogenedens sp.]|nr:Hsp20 family protein [Candidatus Hydrogenedens sp.]
MRTYDLTPLLRSSIGFDRVWQALEPALQANEAAPSYPPYNIEKLGEDKYRIAMAVAGFGEDDLEIVTHEGVLVVKGRAQAEPESATYLYRGIAGRAFERRFQLADYLRVSDARLVNGLLQVDLVREVPEALKPRRITIETAKPVEPALKAA